MAAGISDVLDGIVARRMNLQSSFGEKFDTVADICFVVAILYKLLPVIELPLWMWLWVGIIALMKFVNILYGFIRQRTFVAKHTVANKITGVLLFLFPLSLSFLSAEIGAIVVCSMATIVAIHELFSKTTI